MKDYSEGIHTCQAIQLAAMDVLGDLTSSPDLVNVPAYKELAERMYMTARQAAHVARLLDDQQTAKFTDNIADKIIRIMED